MEEVQPVSTPPTLPQPKKPGGFKRFVRWFTFIVILALGAFIFWKYFYTYSSGYRSGLLQKFSYRGNVFKTYEGELVLSSVASTNNVALASEKFYFSVSNDSIAKIIQGLEGKRVRLHYKQKNGSLFWRGDSEYMVDEVQVETGQ